MSRPFGRPVTLSPGSPDLECARRPRPYPLGTYPLLSSRKQPCAVSPAMGGARRRLSDQG